MNKGGGSWMELRNCPECGRLFRYIGIALCPACVDADDKLFLKVRSHLADHRGIGVDDLAEATEVSVARITRWLREGRMELHVADGTLTCECCDAPIRTGRFCLSCRSHLERGFGGLAQGQPAASTRYDWANLNKGKRG